MSVLYIYIILYIIFHHWFGGQWFFSSQRKGTNFSRSDPPSSPGKFQVCCLNCRRMHLACEDVFFFERKIHAKKNRWFCWWLTSQTTTWDVWNPQKQWDKLPTSTGFLAGFQPSTESPLLFFGSFIFRKVHPKGPKGEYFDLWFTQGTYGLTLLRGTLSQAGVYLTRLFWTRIW